MNTTPFPLITTLPIDDAEIGVYGSLERPKFLVRDILNALKINAITDNLFHSPLSDVPEPNSDGALPQWYTSRDGLRNILTIAAPLKADYYIRTLRRELCEKIGKVYTEPENKHRIPGETPPPKVEEVMAEKGIQSLYCLIDALKQSHLFVAKAFRETYGDDVDMEEYSGFVEIQNNIEAAMAAAITEIADYVHEQIITT